MNNENLQRIKQKTRQKITIYNFRKYNDILQKERKSYVPKTAIVVCSCIILTGGFVFGKDIKNFISTTFFGNSEGINTAIENGYVVNSNSDYLFSNNIGVKIGDIIMDDNYLGVEFEFNLKDKSNSYSDILENNISFEDIIIFDENNNILYCNNKELFTDFCKKYNLTYIWGDHNNNYINSGVSIYSTSNTNCIYNLYSNNYPKSKTLYINAKNITIGQSDKNIELEGNWNFDIEITEEIYNRTSKNFKVSNNIDNINIKDVNVSVTNTRVDLEIKSNTPIEQNSEIKDLTEKLMKEGKSSQEITDILNKKHYKYERVFDNVYIENKNGEKFYQDLNLIEGNSYIIDTKNNTVNATFTFSLTKYDSTDILYLHFKFQNEEYKIELIEM